MDLFKTIGILAGFTVSTTFALENMRDQFLNKKTVLLTDIQYKSLKKSNTIPSCYRVCHGVEFGGPLTIKDDVFKIGENFIFDEVTVTESGILDLCGFDQYIKKLYLTGKIINSSNRDARIDTSQESIFVPAGGSYPPIRALSKKECSQEKY